MTPISNDEDFVIIIKRFLDMTPQKTLQFYLKYFDHGVL